MKKTKAAGTNDRDAHDQWRKGEVAGLAWPAFVTFESWKAALAWERKCTGWRLASETPFPNNPASTIVPVILTVEFPDDPERVTISGGWWSVPEKCWYVNGQIFDHSNGVVIAWMPDVQPFRG